MLRNVPHEWGPRFEYRGVAVAHTHTGPNTISFVASSNMALVMFTPQFDRQVSLSSDRRTTGLAPQGAIEIVPVGTELFARWTQEKQNLLFAIEPDRLQRFAQTEFDTDTFELFPPKLGTVDQRAHDFARLMRWEVENQEHGWRESLDALTTAFSLHLLRTYSSLGNVACRSFAGGLSAKSLRDIQDFIHGNLQRGISLEELSSLAGLSPSHFARSFKQSVGCSAHQFIIKTRLIRARELICFSTMPFSVIALRVGFSSNSHMTALMRKAWGTTPTQLRADR